MPAFTRHVKFRHILLAPTLQTHSPTFKLDNVFKIMKIRHQRTQDKWLAFSIYSCFDYLRDSASVADQGGLLGCIASRIELTIALRAPFGSSLFVLAQKSEIHHSPSSRFGEEICSVGCRLINSHGVLQSILVSRGKIEVTPSIDCRELNLVRSPTVTY